jgi:hypothetical protein
MMEAGPICGSHMIPARLPCPFCGNPDVNVVCYEDSKAWRVVCLPCLHANTETEDAALRAWNRRAASDIYLTGNECCSICFAPLTRANVGQRLVEPPVYDLVCSNHPNESDYL